MSVSRIFSKGNTVVFDTAGREHGGRGGEGPVRPGDGSTIADHGTRDIGPIEGDGALGQADRIEDEKAGEESREVRPAGYANTPGDRQA